MSCYNVVLIYLLAILASGIQENSKLHLILHAK